MLKPSYDDLKGKMEKVKGRYALVMAVSKRAREIIDGKKYSEEEKDINPVTLAVEELAEDRTKFK